MVTKVGLQDDFVSALQDLAELDFDAIEAYEAAINRLENPEYKNKLSEFKMDHVNHTKAINEILLKHDEDQVTGPSLKQLLTQGKVVIAEIFGDKAILSAMLSNEIDTNTAYERLSSHENMFLDAGDFLRRGFEDEKRHKGWIEEELNRIKDKG